MNFKNIYLNPEESSKAFRVKADRVKAEFFWMPILGLPEGSDVVQCYILNSGNLEVACRNTKDPERINSYDKYCPDFAQGLAIRAVSASIAMREVYGYGSSKKYVEEDFFEDPAFPYERKKHSYGIFRSNSGNEIPSHKRVPNLNLEVLVEWGKFKQKGHILFPMPLWGKNTRIEKNTLITEIDVFGVKHKREVPLSDLATVQRAIKYGNLSPESIGEMWAVFFKHNLPNEIPLDGLKALLKQKKIVSALSDLHPTERGFLNWLMSKNSRNKTTNNRLIAKFLKELKKGTAEISSLTDLMYTFPISVRYYDFYGDADTLDERREICEMLPGAKEAIQEAEARADWTKRKNLSSQVEALNIDKKDYPKLHQSILNGDIPSRVFVAVDGSPINQEFQIWEECLRKKEWKETVCEIARNAAGRTTYEKIVTPYLYFCLHTLPKYLSKNAGGKWKCIPKYVKSSWELEMEDSEDPNGTVKKRSAFTPTVDMSTKTVTVPYVGLSVGGVRTQWCYSLLYMLFEKGQVDLLTKQIIPHTLCEKLNGRDDYGLMYYTLTGTATATGYPTFLIIFEKNKFGTVVHFHRVRPCRSKNGKKTSPKDLIQACYKYMAGNVSSDEIFAQQGDLMFIQLDHDPIERKASVSEPIVGDGIVFESHSIKRMEDRQINQISLYPSTAKTPKNRLGFLHLPQDGKVEHPEHDYIDYLPAGWYEIRRCKSWEANPVSIMSLTID